VSAELADIYRNVSLVNVGGLLYSVCFDICIVAFVHTLSVMLLAYGKMWQKDVLTVAGGSFDMVHS